MKISFTKMHGLGNDFILIDCRRIKLQVSSGLAEKLCHRRFGIGADQLLLLYPSERADFKMRIFNPDGSEVEMCGNGIRCFAKYVWQRGLAKKKILAVETAGGIIKPEKKAGGFVRVDMGEPIFDPKKIPVKIPQKRKGRGQKPGTVIDYPLRIEDRKFGITCVSMGNPHAVIVVDNAANFPVAYYGPKIENHPLFPKRTNVEFIQILDPSSIIMRVWERGAGETMACGTGASAAAVVSHLKGFTGKNITVHLTGGDLAIEWAGDNHVYMTGPAEEVFTGEIDVDVV